MAEYIKKQDALNAICSVCGVIPEGSKELCPYKFSGCKEYQEMFSIPSIDVKPVKHGFQLGVDNGRFKKM